MWQVSLSFLVLQPSLIVRHRQGVLPFTKLWASRVKGYAIRQVTEKLSDGAQVNRLVRVPKPKLAEWDATHDDHGNPIEKDVMPIATI